MIETQHKSNQITPFSSLNTYGAHKKMTLFDPVSVISSKFVQLTWLRHQQFKAQVVSRAKTSVLHHAADIPEQFFGVHRTHASAEGLEVDFALALPVVRADGRIKKRHRSMA